MYFDASYDNDGEKMIQVFHRVAHVYSRGEDGRLSDMDRDAFTNRVGSGKDNAAKDKYPRYNEILSIDFTGENAAVARVKIRVRNTIFTDILSFIRFEGKWVIISKLASGVPAE